MLPIAPAKITTVAVSSRSQPTGRLPIIMSRKVPPPIAVTKESMSTPKGSSFFCMAKKAPDTAKEKVPKISITCKKPKSIICNSVDQAK